MDKRLFIAVKYSPDEHFLQSYNSIKTNINAWASVKWVDTQHLHLTLCFLGNTPVSLLKPIEKVMTQVGNSTHSFEAKISSLNTFSRQRQLGVLWMGLHPPEKFQSMHQQLIHGLNHEFSKLGKNVITPQLPASSHFVPHLTLGRFRTTYNHRKIFEFINQYNETTFGFWTVKQIILYESILSSIGPTYYELFIAENNGNQ
jgi:2'-5' RNA ligase